MGQPLILNRMMVTLECLTTMVDQLPVLSQTMVMSYHHQLTTIQRLWLKLSQLATDAGSENMEIDNTSNQEDDPMEK